MTVTNVFVPPVGPWLKYLRGSAHVAGTPITLDRSAALPLVAATVTVAVANYLT